MTKTATSKKSNPTREDFEIEACQIVSICLPQHDVETKRGEGRWTSKARALRCLIARALHGAYIRGRRDGRMLGSIRIFRRRRWYFWEIIVDGGVIAAGVPCRTKTTAMEAARAEWAALAVMPWPFMCMLC
jgi:hypothetical protein